MKKQPLDKISEREQDVMRIIWNSNEGLTASEIAEQGISINTVQAALRNLMKKGYIEIAKIVYSGTVLTRSYRSIVDAEQYALNQLNSFSSAVSNFSALNLINNLYTETDNKSIFLHELEKMIEEKKKQILEDK